MRLSNQTDAAIIEKSLADPNVFGEIFRRHSESVYKFLAKRVGRQDAADLGGEVFARAFRGRHLYRTSEPNCRPWLIGIARNLLGERYRSRVYQPMTEPGTPIELPEDVIIERVMASQVSSSLATALEKLSAADKETFIMYAVDGLTYSEVGKSLGIPAGTVASRISRARRIISDAIPDLGTRTGRADGSGRASNVS